MTMTTTPVTDASSLSARYVMGIDDLREVYRLTARLLYRRADVLAILAGPPLVLVGALGAAWYASGIWLIAAFIAALEIWLVRRLYTGRVIDDLERRLAEELPKDPAVTLEVNDSGIRTTTAHRTAWYGWAGMTDFAESPALFLITGPGQRVIVAPKRGLASEADVVAMRKLLARRLRRRPM